MSKPIKANFYLNPYLYIGTFAQNEHPNTHTIPKTCEQQKNLKFKKKTFMGFVLITHAIKTWSLCGLHTPKNIVL